MSGCISRLQKFLQSYFHGFSEVRFAAMLGICLIHDGDNQLYPIAQCVGSALSQGVAPGGDHLWYAI